MSCCRGVVQKLEDLTPEHFVWGNHQMSLFQPAALLFVDLFINRVQGAPLLHGGTVLFLYFVDPRAQGGGRQGGGSDGRQVTVALFTVLYISRYPVLHVWPPVESCSLAYCRGQIRVFWSCCIMDMKHDFML